MEKIVTKFQHNWGEKNIFSVKTVLTLMWPQNMVNVAESVMNNCMSKLPANIYIQHIYSVQENHNSKVWHTRLQTN